MRHGGTVTVDPEHSPGARLVMSLPLPRAVEQSPGKQATPGIPEGRPGERRRASRLCDGYSMPLAPRGSPALPSITGRPPRLPVSLKRATSVIAAMTPTAIPLASG